MLRVPANRSDSRNVKFLDELSSASVPTEPINCHAFNRLRLTHGANPVICPKTAVNKSDNTVKSDRAYPEDYYDPTLIVR